MTNKEAISIIQEIEEDGRNVTSKHIEALALAIKALEFIAEPVIPATTKVIISDDFGNEIKGFYDKGRDLIFTSYGIVPRSWIEPKYKIAEVKKYEVN